MMISLPTCAVGLLFTPNGGCKIVFTRKKIDEWISAITKTFYAHTMIKPALLPILESDRF
jgi:hypothetical protein